MILLWMGRAVVQGADDLVMIQTGQLPIIISAPHGGNQSLPDVETRQQRDRPTGGSGFVVSRDLGTEELALEFAAALEKRLRARPHLVISRVHRKFIDFNRPADLAYDDPDARPLYEEYHRALQTACRAVQDRFQRGLLIDIHGQILSADTVYRGTHDGKTMSLLRERFGAEAFSGEMSLFGRLKSRGWRVHPDPLDGTEQPGYRGGYIVKTYGSHQNTGVDAVQLEFGDRYRSRANRAATVQVLTEAVADYYQDFLVQTVPVPAK